MYCDGCDTEALNCKPITNLKEKSELSNFTLNQQLAQTCCYAALRA
jgi:hypothetical protein